MSYLNLILMNRNIFISSLFFYVAAIRLLTLSFKCLEKAKNVNKEFYCRFSCCKNNNEVVQDKCVCKVAESLECCSHGNGDLKDFTRYSCCCPVVLAFVY